MSYRDLAAKYGDGRNPSGRALINRAIRAELVGGDHGLDALNALDQLVYKFKERGRTEGLADAEAALRHTHAVARSLRAEVRRRYGIPPEQEAD